MHFEALLHASMTFGEGSQQELGVHGGITFMSYIVKTSILQLLEVPYLPSKGHNDR